MSHVHRRIIALTVTTLLWNVTIAAAQTPALLRGTHLYSSRGSYDGDWGDPWDSRIDIADTTVAAAKVISITQRSHTTGDTFGFTTTALWSPEKGVMQYASSGSGHDPGNCKIDEINGAKGRLTIDDGKPTDVTLGDRAVPEFALASILAAGPLADGDSPHYTAYRCSWSSASPAPMSTFAFNGHVTSGSLARNATTTAEPVWIVTGDNAFGYTAWIAKSDREVLKVVTPQGSVGFMEDTFERLITSSR